LQEVYFFFYKDAVKFYFKSRQTIFRRTRETTEGTVFITCTRKPYTLNNSPYIVFEFWVT